MSEIDLPGLRAQVDEIRSQQERQRRVSLRGERLEAKVRREATQDFNYLAQNRPLLAVLSRAKKILSEIDPEIIISITNPELAPLAHNKKVDIRVVWALKDEGFQGPGGWMETGYEDKYPTFIWKDIIIETSRHRGLINGVKFLYEGHSEVVVEDAGLKVENMALVANTALTHPMEHRERVLDYQANGAPLSLRNRLSLDI